MRLGIHVQRLMQDNNSTRPVKTRRIRSIRISEPCAWYRNAEVLSWLTKWRRFSLAAPR